jgi:uncharacterized surface protein with fasciclin (FAS1) repeats
MTKTTTRALTTGFAYPALALSLAIAGCSSEDESTIVDIARSNPDFTTLSAALEQTGLDQSLAGEGPFTVFAPTDAAFDRLPPGMLEEITSETLSQILLYHVVAGDVRASDVVAIDSAETLAGAPVAIRADGDVVLNSLTRVTTTDIVADNGVIHVIDSVMMPLDLTFPGTLVEAAAAYPSLDILVGAVGDVSLAGALAGDNEGQGLTLFAPGNAAFESLGIDLSSLTSEQLTDVLLYHVVGGTVAAADVVRLDSAPTLQGGAIAIEVTADGVVLNDQTAVVRTDLFVENGVLHVIDGVLLPQ